MKRTIFIASLSAFLSLNSNVFAYTIISQHSECHGNKNQCELINVQMNGSINGEFKKTMIPYSVHATTVVNNQFGYNLQATTLKAHHEVHMHNGDDHKKRYHYFFEIKCADMVNKFDYDVDLEGHEEFTTSADSLLDVIFKTGTYDILATTDISNSESDRQGRRANLYIR